MIDEIDFSKFVGSMNITGKDLALATMDHPNSVIRELSSAMRTVLDQHYQNHKEANRYEDFHNWYGDELYHRIDQVLKVDGGSLKALIKELLSHLD